MSGCPTLCPRRLRWGASSSVIRVKFLCGAAIFDPRAPCCVVQERGHTYGVLIDGGERRRAAAVLLFTSVVDDQPLASFFCTQPIKCAPRRVRYNPRASNKRAIPFIHHKLNIYISHTNTSTIRKSKAHASHLFCSPSFPLRRIATI